MSDKLLNESCFFQCNGNSSILITAKELGRGIAKDGRQKILTNKAKCEVKVPLQCNFLTVQAGGTPIMCQMMQTVWQGASSKMKCSGNPVLTAKSSITCICGGEIKPRSSTCISAIGSNQAVSDMADNLYIGNHQTENKVSNADISDNKRDKKQQEERILKESGNESTANISDDKVEETAYASYTMCDYENCNERVTCDYFNSQIFVNNNSAKLSSSFQKLRKDEWTAYETKHNQKLRESSEGSWNIAAHHIISGNQVLMMKEGDVLLFGHIVKLANYFHYDINHAVNCIMLPTNDGNFGEKEPVNKVANAYEVMWLMGRQWHVGGHKYSLSKDTLKILEDYYKKYPEQCLKSGNGEIFADYATAVKEELDKLSRKYSRPRCWKENYEKRRQKFIDDMNCVSAKIEKYLLDFEKDPKKSFPFYVSKTAFEYAFQLPSAVKIIVIYQENLKLRAKKIRMERYKKNRLQIIPKEIGDMEITDIKSLAVFCENAMYFVVDRKVNQKEQEQYCFQTVGDKDIRPEIWEIELQGKDLQKIGVMKYLSEHGNEIFAFIQQKEFPYQPIAKLVFARGG